MGLPQIAVPSYSLTLPSSEKEVKYRPFLVKEEKLLLIAMESEDEKQIVNATKDVIRNCVFGDIDVDEMPIFDIEYIFLWLRGRAKGEQIELKYTCPDCTSSIDVNINLDDIKVNISEEHEQKIEIDDNIGIVLKYPNLTMQSKLEELEGKDSVETLFKSVQLCIDYIYDSETIYSAKDHTEKEMQDFIESLTDVQFKKLSKFFETMPKLQHTINLKCNNTIKGEKDKKNKKCPYKEEKVVEGLSSFFD